MRLRVLVVTPTLLGAQEELSFIEGHLTNLSRLTGTHLLTQIENVLNRYTQMLIIF